MSRVSSSEKVKLGLTAFSMDCATRDDYKLLGKTSFTFIFLRVTVKLSIYNDSNRVHLHFLVIQFMKFFMSLSSFLIHCHDFSFHMIYKSYKNALKSSFFSDALLSVNFLL